MENRLFQSSDELDHSLKLKQLLKKTGEFIAYFEIFETKMLNWKQEMQTHYAQYDALLLNRLQELELHLNSLNEIMTEAGAARFRISAEACLQQSHSHLAKMEKLGKQYLEDLHKQQLALQTLAAQHVEQLNVTEKKIACKINNFIKRLNVEELAEVTQTAKQTIEIHTVKAMYQNEKLIKKFQWKTFGLAFVIIIANTLAMGLYLSNELPWEIHQTAVQERTAGQTLLSAWSSLDEETQHKILAYSKKPSS